VKGNEAQAREAIMALRRFRDDIEHIMELLEGKRDVTSEENMHLHGLLRKLKKGLNRAARTGTVSGLRAPHNYFEETYYAPAVSEASANLTIRVNSHPIRSNWFPCLYVVKHDITYMLDQLESQFPE
jgi:hypothetical protein